MNRKAKTLRFLPLFSGVGMFEKFVERRFST